MFVVGSFWGNGSIETQAVVAGGSAIWMSVAQADVLNDIADREVDKIDKPDRPIPSGAVTVRVAVRFYATVCAASVVLGLLSSAEVGAGMVALIVGAAVYCLVLKSTVLVGNLLIAVMSSAPFLLGVYSASALGSSALVASLLISLFMLSFELVKTAMDMDGDRAAGLTTMATKNGVRATLRLALLVFLGECVVALFLVGGTTKGLLFGLIFTFLLAVPAIYAFVSVLSSGYASPADAGQLFHTLQRLWKFGFLCLAILAWG
jgi:geranylgeranylglycerol-phosphate geranylgeranyltransferase